MRITNTTIAALNSGFHGAHVNCSHFPETDRMKIVVNCTHTTAPQLISFVRELIDATE